MKGGYTGSRRRGVTVQDTKPTPHHNSGKPSSARNARRVAAKKGKKQHGPA